MPRLVALLLIALCAQRAKGRFLLAPYEYGSGGSDYGSGGSSYAPAPAPDYGGHDHEYSDDDTYYYPRPKDYGKVYQLEWKYPSDWSPPKDAYETQSAWVGDTVNFTWTGNYGVWRIPDGNCPDSYDASKDGYYRVSDAKQDSYATYKFKEPGTYWFASPVTGQCKAGMLVKYEVKPYKYEPKYYEVVWQWPSDFNPPRESYKDRQAWVGDTVNYTWTGNHGLWGIPWTGKCPESYDSSKDGYKEYSAPKNGGWASVHWDEAGDYWYACPVKGHCEAGMRQKWTVKDYYKYKKYDIDWKPNYDNGAGYKDREAYVGDWVEFKWPESAQYGVWRIPEGKCPDKWDEYADGYEVVYPLSYGGDAKYRFDKPGTYWFASPGGTNCKDKQLIKWTVKDWFEEQAVRKACKLSTSCTAPRPPQPRHTFFATCRDWYEEQGYYAEYSD
ncbi:hypothetical protein COHA_002464 [Chlorella ohadii]|uniref:Uncharacterized protein n=1 Tax=Chlorella ohadii TaxID=2649997 RepID=A0AAD5H8P0_9CHLO|nr:hypothetical protein COHA_002464 [Chlorella ohadii]